MTDVDKTITGGEVAAAAAALAAKGFTGIGGQAPDQVAPVAPAPTQAMNGAPMSGESYGSPYEGGNALAGPQSSEVYGGGLERARPDVDPTIHTPLHEGQYASPFDSGLATAPGQGATVSPYAPVPGAPAPATGPSPAAGAPPPGAPGVSDAVRAASERLLTPPDQRLDETATMASLVSGGMSEGMAKSLWNHGNRTEIQQYLARTPAPVVQPASQAGQSATTAQPAAGVAPPPAGMTDGTLAEIETALAGSILEESAAESIVGALRGMQADSNQARQETEALRSELNQLQSHQTQHQITPDQVEAASTQMAAAIEGLAGQFPAILDEATFRDRLMPNVELMEQARPELSGDIPALMRMAAQATFGGPAPSAAPPQRTVTPQPPPAAAVPSGSRHAAPTPMQLALHAMGQLKRGVSREEIVGEAQRFGRR